jgi:hypothetical protein
VRVLGPAFALVAVAAAFAVVYGAVQALGPFPLGLNIGVDEMGLLPQMEPVRAPCCAEPRTDQEVAPSAARGVPPPRVTRQ